MIHRTQSLRVINMLLGKTQCQDKGNVTERAQPRRIPAE